MPTNQTGGTYPIGRDTTTGKSKTISCSDGYAVNLKTIGLINRPIPLLLSGFEQGGYSAVAWILLHTRDLNHLDWA